METKYTNGEWKLDNSHSKEYEGIQIWADDVIIAHVVDDQHQNKEANAKLISAAPEMAAMLRELRHAIRYGEKVPQATMDARITRILTKAGL